VEHQYTCLQSCANQSLSCSVAAVASGASGVGVCLQSCLMNIVPFAMCRVVTRLQHTPSKAHAANSSCSVLHVMMKATLHASMCEHRIACRIHHGDCCVRCALHWCAVVLFHRITYGHIAHKWSTYTLVEVWRCVTERYIIVQVTQ
jgi:hypothetical protein